MRGNVIGFDADTNTGAISGHDGRRYDFVTQDWRGQGVPRSGDTVDFVADGSRATQIFLLEPEWVPPNWRQRFFSVHGRSGRSYYWVSNILLSIAIMVLYLIFLLIGLVIGFTASGAAVTIYAIICGVIIFILLIWPYIAINGKRIHDRNKSAWLILIPVALQILADASILASVVLSIVLGLAAFVVGVWFFVEFGCMRGTVGPNRYGPDPVFGEMMRVYGHMVTRTR